MDTLDMFEGTKVPDIYNVKIIGEYIYNDVHVL
jgi:hypothetical protein